MGFNSGFKGLLSQRQFADAGAGAHAQTAVTGEIKDDFGRPVTGQMIGGTCSTCF